MIRRRDLIAMLGGTAVVWAPAARAQPPSPPVVGMLSGAEAPQELSTFLGSLADSGLVEGRDFTIVARWAEGHYERFPAIAAEMVQMNVAAIMANPTAAAQAAKAATSTIPIVFLVGTDPVKAGLVQSMNRPGGNLTGFTLMSLTLMAKQFEIMHELVPQSTVIAVLYNSSNAADAESVRNVEALALKLGRQLAVTTAERDSDFASALETASARGAGGLIVSSDPLFFFQRKPLLESATRSALPAVYAFHETVLDGGLMSYGTDTTRISQEAYAYVAKILKGANPADLPVQQPTTFHLAINLKTAKALDLTIPPTLLARADEVIE